MDPIYLEKSNYVEPEENLKRPYALLPEAMQGTGYYAIAKVAMHDLEHVVILRPAVGGIVLHTMYFEDELHKMEKLDLGDTNFRDTEVDLAKRPIDTLAAPFRPAQYHDDYRENVQRLVEQKKAGKKITSVAQPKVAPVVDILDALRKSLESKKASAADPASRKAPAASKKKSASSRVKRGAA